jgi:hypothetical protein
MTTKTDRRAAKSHKSRYGHYGAGASHTRETGELEFRGAIRKILAKKHSKGRK